MKHQKSLLEASDKLSQEQPSPDEHALSFPTVIALRPAYSFSIPFLGIIGFMSLPFIGTAIWILIVFFTTPYDPRYTGYDPIVAAFVGGVGLFFSMFFWLFWVRFRNWVKVSEAGLAARYFGRKMEIAWEDARFFSVIVGDQRIYTLSGEQGNVTWTQLTLDSNSSLKPRLPFDVYQKQSNALLEVIVGKTGLPLYESNPEQEW